MRPRHLEFWRTTLLVIRSLYMVIKRLSDYSSRNGMNLSHYHRVYPQRRPIARNANTFLSKWRAAVSLQAIAVFALASLSRRIRIENATVWQLLDTDGKCHGQAAMLPQTLDIEL